jgi:hypothetical protein
MILIHNNGQVGCVAAAGTNLGMFSPRFAPNAEPFRIHPSFIANGRSVNTVFDIESSTFFNVGFQALSPRLNNMQPAVLPFMPDPPRNIPFTLVRMLATNTNNNNIGIAIMKSRTEDRYFFANVTSSANFPLTTFSEIPPGMKMPSAEVMAAPQSGNFVWFADGNRLYAYRHADLEERELLLQTFPAGETISFINNVFVSAGAVNYLVVLTNSTSGWNLYVYDVISNGLPEINTTTPAVTRSGTGNGRFVMYRHS